MFVEGLRKTIKSYEWHHVKLFSNFSHPFADLKRAHTFVSGDVSLGFVTEFGVPMGLARLITVISIVKPM
jgi:hypothetical protein